MQVVDCIFQYHKLLAQIACYNLGGQLLMDANDIFCRLSHFSFHSPRLQMWFTLTALFSCASSVSQSFLQQQSPSQECQGSPIPHQQLMKQ